VRLTSDNCAVNVSDFTLKAPRHSGLDISLGTPSADGCQRSAAISIDKKAKLGLLSLTVQKKGSVFAKVGFTVADAQSQPALSPDAQTLNATIAQGFSDLNKALTSKTDALEKKAQDLGDKVDKNTRTLDAQGSTMDDLTKRTASLEAAVAGQQNTIAQLQAAKQAEQSSAAAAPIKISVSPPAVQPVNGKLPASINLAVSADPPCGADSTLDLTKYRISLSGSGLTLGSLNTGQCTITSAVTIDPSAPAGSYDVVLSDANGLVRGKAKFSVLDTTAGPIPPGMGPEVDVLWTVMSNKVSSDVFGYRVAKRFYCIEVKIGNNSGHALQIAGIGFDNNSVYGTELRQANSSYASTRAVLQRESSISKRNVIYHSIEGAGLLMAAFTPYFARSNPHKNWATATTIVSGALVQAIDLVVPDRVPGQLNNLDDQSLRDGSVIANNTQVRTTIFIEKKELTEALDQAQRLLLPKINKHNDGAGSEGQDQGGKNPMFDSARAARKTISNSNKEAASGSESPFLIKMALGKLILVGDPIDYLPRVQIVSNPSPGAIAVNISPQNITLAVTKQQTFTATVTGASTTTVTWTVSCAASAAMGQAACGAIDSNGVYTAPTTVPNPITVTVTATSTVDTTKSGSAAVIIVAAAAPPATTPPAPSSTLTITTSTLPDGKVQTPYSQSLVATGGTGNLTWSITSGSLPAGLTLDASKGVISGTPSATASATPLTINVTDSSTPTAQTATVSLTLTIASQ
jgi:hypothetical protein